MYLTKRRLGNWQTQIRIALGELLPFVRRENGFKVRSYDFHGIFFDILHRVKVRQNQPIDCIARPYLNEQETGALLLQSHDVKFFRGRKKWPNISFSQRSSSPTGVDKVEQLFENIQLSVTDEHWTRLLLNIAASTGLLAAKMEMWPPIFWPSLERNWMSQFDWFT